jgi:hypothetical protein
MEEPILICVKTRESIMNRHKERDEAALQIYMHVVPGMD